MNGTDSLSAQLIIDCVNGLRLFNVAGMLLKEISSGEDELS